MAEIANEDGEEKYYQIKINIFSKDEKIIHKFLQAIKATTSPVKPVFGKEIAYLSYRSRKKLELQFWSMSTEQRFRHWIPNILTSSFGIIYFYDIAAKIEEDFLNLLKSSSTPEIPIIFVGYDSIIPQGSEQNDNDINIPIIQKYYDDFNSFYISTNESDSMVKLLDPIIVFVNSLLKSFP